MLLVSTKTAGGGTGATLSKEDGVGTVDGSNTAFTVTNEPLFAMVSGVISIDGDGYTLSGSGPYTLTFDVAPWTTPRVFYNA